MSASPLSHVSVRFSRSRGIRTEELEGQVVRNTREGLAIEWTELAPTRVRTLMLIPIPASQSLWPVQETTEAVPRRPEG